MKDIVSGKHAATASEFAELALGVEVELFTGPAGGESAIERDARLDAAHAILADLRREAPDLAAYAARLLVTDPTQGLWTPRLLLGGTTGSGKSTALAMLRQVAA